MTLKDLLVKLRTLWRAVVSDQRSYGCLPEADALSDARPAEKADPSFPKSANSVEKDSSLR
jgi:hypothetical protein